MLLRVIIRMKEKIINLTKNKKLKKPKWIRLIQNKINNKSVN